MTKRPIRPALNVCGVCRKLETEKHQGHSFKCDDAVSTWQGWCSLRRMHGGRVREKSGSSDTASKALGNTKEVADRHYVKPVDILPDVREAVGSAFSGLIAS